MPDAGSHPARRPLPGDGQSTSALRTVALIGAVSAVLYGVVYAMQRAIFRNGLRDLAGVPLAAGVPASVANLRWQGIAYLGATLGLFLLYACLLLLCRRGALDDRLARRLALLFPVLFHLALLFGRPYLSIDLFSYLGHGYLGTRPAGNPYAQSVSSVDSSAFGRQIAALGWVPVHAESPYGPLWTQIEIAVLRLSDDIPTAMLLLKAVVVAASLGSAALIWTILGRVRPGDQLLGTLLYLWNPLIVIEFAGEGHNDALMIMFVLAALALAVAARPAAAVVAMALGVLTKYLPLLLLPALVVYVWRTRSSGRHAVRQLLLGGVVSLALAALVYAPLWIGGDTFGGIRATGRPDDLPSPAGVVYARLAAQSPRTAAATTQLIVGAALALVVAGASWSVRTAQRLLIVCALIALFYPLAALPGYYWPWYAALPLALMALSPRGGFLWMTMVLSVCGRVVAPIADVANNGFLPWPAALPLTTAIGATLPLLVGLLLGGVQLLASPRPWHRGRSAHP